MCQHEKVFNTKKTGIEDFLFFSSAFSLVRCVLVSPQPGAMGGGGGGGGGGGREREGEVKQQVNCTGRKYGHFSPFEFDTHRSD